MPNVKFSKSVIDKLPLSEMETILWDTNLAGFGLRVKPNGTKSYVIQCRTRSSGRSRRKTIGQHGPLMTYNQAKTIATGLLSDVVRGADPVTEAKDVRNAKAVTDLAEQYMTVHAIPKKRRQSVVNDQAMLKNQIIPKLGALKVAEVTHRDVQTYHNGLKATPYQANRNLSLLSKMFELSIKWGMRTDNPTKGVEKFHEEKRHRWLSSSELDRMSAALDRHANQKAANAIRPQLLTGARIGEILSATWSNFDLERGVCIKSSHHTKQKRTEHLPLSKAAVTLLKGIQTARSTDATLVFPGRTPEKPMVDLRKFWWSLLADAEISDYRMHDNRHTHASQLVSSGLSLAIVGRLLGHTNPMTTQRYAHIADDPLREAAEVMAAKMVKKR